MREEKSTDQISRYPQRSEDIDLMELAAVVWRGKWLTLAMGSAAGVFCLCFALLVPNKYEAYTVLVPAESSGGGISSLVQQYGSLASLAGVSLPSGEIGSRTQLGMQLMKSRKFITDFADRRNILPEILAVKRWDEDSGQLILDPEVYDEKNASWVENSLSLDDSVPSPSLVYKKFLASLNVSRDPQTGFIVITIEHESPLVAAKWAGWLVEDVNESVRTQEVEEAAKSIAYLKQQVQNTSLADLQAMFFELIQSQTETIMLAEVRPEYVFKTVDPPIVPEESSKPNRAIITTFGVIFGLMFGFATCLVRHYVFGR